MKKLLITILTIAITAALVFALSGCKKEDPYIVKSEINDSGELVVYYNNGETENLGSVDNGSSAEENPLGLELTLKDDETYSVSVGNAVNITEIVIPAKYAGKPVTDIDSHGFAYLKDLTKITIPSSIIGIGDYAFEGCENLSEISTISANTIYLGTGVFNNCPKLTSLQVDELNPIYEIVNGSLYTKDGKTLVKCILPEGATSYHIGASVTDICAGAFADCKNLKSLTFDVAKDWMYDEGYIPDYIVADAEQMAWYAKESFYCTYKAALKGERDTTPYTLTLDTELSEDWESLERCSWVYFEFQPTSTGYYHFDIKNGEESIFASLNVYQTDTADNGTPITTTVYPTGGYYKLESDRAYSIKVSGLTDFEELSFAISVHAATDVEISSGMSFGDAIVISEGMACIADITTGNQNVYFKFTAAYSGTYTFYSSGNYDTYGTLYNSSQSQLDSDDDDGDGNNFSMSRYMSAGETVYLVARMYGGSNTGSFDVYVS